ncbi:alcohol dehydrogenase catalytic domain-containing protein [Nocardioides sp. cx-169]|uniref:zinc-binding dehydrogenase n=1 Tax=Nocardioides sp. cx-169 TaxID=2899080 RepID=UPI001E60685E|nr:alcohol dehydrogenase catalytic domain-containing protein [Nocardioides sp. cx-169]MCD4534346.1 alcohol dehydrogenase catalytic domain-containing protein [Nocardioides sp. cx-169]
MRATLIYGAGDVRVEHVPDPAVQEPTDALVRITTSCVCGSDLHAYGAMPPGAGPARMGHELIGVVEEVGSEVATVRKGDVVVSPFAFSCGTCEYCRAGLQTSCPTGGFLGMGGNDGAQAEAARIPLADGTLVVLPVAVDDVLMPSLLTLADVLGTGYHAAAQARIAPGDSVTVIGDGAVGLLAVLSARMLGAEQIILMGRHRDRTDLGREFGATDVVAERGEEGVTRVRELTGGQGTHAVLEAVGHVAAYEQAFGVVRPGGVISRVGVPQYQDAPVGFGSLFRGNVTLTGGPAPVRAYLDRLLPRILEGAIEPGKVFDRGVDLDGVPGAYRAMADREALKVLVRL